MGRDGFKGATRQLQSYQLGGQALDIDGRMHRLLVDTFHMLSARVTHVQACAPKKDG